jgi:glutamate dehydrogenase/leucine dehydrogenase
MMFERMQELGHEMVVYGVDPETGLRAVIAIHSTRLGPALGGTRFYPYDSEESAVLDALRLSEGMTAKAALAGLGVGGGKGVIIGDPNRDKTPELLAAYGRLVAGLNGRFITAEDMGVAPEDVDLIGQAAGGWTVGGSREAGGSGDPSPWTAMGVERSIRAVMRRLTGTDDMAGRTVAIAGVGKVGSVLARRLATADCNLVVADVDRRAVERLRGELAVDVVEPDAVHRCEADVFAPCAIGRVLDERRIAELRCRAVVGSANDQLAAADADARLMSRGILYAPDFVVNAGGLISAVDELDGWDARRVEARVEAIPSTLRDVLDLAESSGSTPHQAARQLAAACLARAAPSIGREEHLLERRRWKVA